MLSHAEENYLKAIYNLTSEEGNPVSTNNIAAHMGTSSPSVSDMLQKLAKKKVIIHAPYKGVQLSEEGRLLALGIIRRHRLWEVFLVEKLGFGWDEVHPLADELEHIQHEGLANRLADFLGNPDTDPHGDPIPDEKGALPNLARIHLSQAQLHLPYVLTGVADSSALFLQVIQRYALGLGSTITVLRREDFDGSLELQLAPNQYISISKEVAANILVSAADG